ncbi:Amidohydrolase family [Geosmithia morbida]|uniref:Amidohydrolase family n=1 Tax=Geosmithia morbida TaxID=1094350 RepID=A0A9P4YRX3_9HYPO|nr:Amidohydrolase family [Geosmithia morbida]KAF4121422.1 Amidohydrolase family [Geosmithia morbida]
MPQWHGGPHGSHQRTAAGLGKSSITSCILAIVTTYYLSTRWTPTRVTAPNTFQVLPAADLEYGVSQCALNQQHPVVNYELATERLSLPRNGIRTVFYNATLINGDGEVTLGCSIEMQGSIFTKVSTTFPSLEDLSSSSDAAFVDLQGRIVTPGLVDVHSHAGVRETPQLWATEDVTEISAPLTPWGRAVDALKPHDQAIPIIGSGGVTTSLVLTGAKNLISGEGVVVKMRQADSVRDMLVNVTEGSPKPMRYLKMAMGENQKRQFENVPGGPSTRLGESYWFRKAYDNARRLKQEQDMWCEAASTTAGRESLSTEYPRSLEWQTLVDVLRGNVRVNIHGYETEDILAMFDHADEFGFKITALHHALHSDLVAEEIKRRGISIVGFSDSWGDKKELYDVSSYLPKHVVDHGVPFALTRDHPAEHGQWLIYEAQIAHHFGLDTEHAISSVIGEPARIMGLSNRLGFVKPGYDADLVIWDRHPLRVGATPLGVYIEGNSVVRASEELWRKSEGLAYARDAPPVRPSTGINSSCDVGQSDFVLHGITQSYIGDNGLRGDGIYGRNLTAVVRSGKVVCVGGSSCQDDVKDAEQEGVAFINVSDGYLVPGLTIVTRQHGLVEMRQEPSTTDGASSGEEYSRPLESRFGIKFDGVHVRRAYTGGITRIVTPPITTGFFHGISTRFRAGAESVLDDGAISASGPALHFTIGHDGKSSKLHDLLTIEKHIHPAYQRAVDGDMPVVIHTNNKDVIAHMIALKRETGAHIVIMGGGEAHLLASQLADAEIPVIVSPFWGCEPLFWDGRNCLPGPPLTDAFGPQVLLDAGVTVGISNWDDTNNHIRTSIWEAGWIAGPGNHSLALDLVSKNIETILKLEPVDDFVVYEGNPFDFGARVAMSFEEGKVRACMPDVD